MTSQTQASSKPDEDRLSGLTAAIARFGPGLQFSDVGDEVLRISRRCILDGLAVMLAGTEQPGMEPLDRFVRRMSGAPDARLFGEAGTRLPAPLAALWNGT